MAEAFVASEPVGSVSRGCAVAIAAARDCTARRERSSVRDHGARAQRIVQGQMAAPTLDLNIAGCARDRSAHDEHGGCGGGTMKVPGGSTAGTPTAVKGCASRAARCGGGGEPYDVGT